MKQGRALPEVLMELKRQNEAKKDFISPAQAFHLEDDGATFGITHLNTGKQEAFATTDLFHRQVGSTLGIPAKYYDLKLRRSKNVNNCYRNKHIIHEYSGLHQRIAIMLQRPIKY